MAALGSKTSDWAWLGDDSLDSGSTSPTWTVSGGSDENDPFTSDLIALDDGDSTSFEGFDLGDDLVVDDVFEPFNPAMYASSLNKPRVTRKSEAPPAAAAPAAAPAPATAPKSDSAQRLQQCVALPQHIMTLLNAGDLDALRALVDTHFTADCVLKTKTMTSAVTGRAHVFRFFQKLIELFPDGIFSFKRSNLGKLNEVTFHVETQGTSMCSLGVTNEYLIPKDGCLLKKLGDMTKKIIQSARRYFFPCEKDRLLAVEKKIRLGLAMPVLAGELVGKFAFAPRAHSPDGVVQVSSAEFSFRLKNMFASTAGALPSAKLLAQGSPACGAFGAGDAAGDPAALTAARGRGSR